MKIKLELLNKGDLPRFGTKNGGEVEAQMLPVNVDVLSGVINTLEFGEKEGFSTGIIVFDNENNKVGAVCV